MPTFTGFRRWFEAGFGSETLPVIPPAAELTEGSTVRPHHRGKTPGTFNARTGRWSGLGGRWSLELRATDNDGKKWSKWGASVGLQSRYFLGLDIDVEDETAVSVISELALIYLGTAPVRYREGSSRRLRMYCLAQGHAPIKKRRLVWLDDASKKQAVELLGHGQQYVVEGMHPSGPAYLWDDYPTAYDVTEITAEHVEQFFAALLEVLKGDGLQIVTDAAGEGSSAGSRRPIGDPGLAAPSVQLVCEALKAWPNTDENVPTHDDFVAALAAIKASLGGRKEHGEVGEVFDWAGSYAGNDGAYFWKTWDSIADSEIGWEWLAAKARNHGYNGDAQDDFGDTADATENQPATPLGKAQARFVYVGSLDRYFDTGTGDLCNGRQFNAANTALADFGSSGKQSAEAIFQNGLETRKAAMLTYRPGRELMLDDKTENGATVSAVNSWRASPVLPDMGATSVADVQPWYDLTVALFGEPGSPAFEHWLDWQAFAIQNPGVKINHAPVLLGGQGIGKDTLLAAFFNIVGTHNVKEVRTEQLQAQFTDFLQAQICYCVEMASFERREVYNRLKGFVAAPPHYVLINRKNQHPFKIPNIQLWIFATNYEDAVSLDDDDRRFWVHRCLLETPREQAFYDAVWRFYAHEDGYAKVAGYLKHRDVGAFNPSAKPPMTEAKAEMVDNSLPAPTRWLGEQFEEGGCYAARTILSARELIEHARSAFECPSVIQGAIREKHAVAALKRSGFTCLGKKYRSPKGGPIVRLWVKGRAGLYEQLDPATLVKRYEDDKANRALATEEQPQQA